MLRDILIVGAGLTGLTAAVELARRGIVPQVIDKRDGPSNLSRAVGILRPSMEILDPSGVADRIRAEAIVFTAVVRALVPRVMRGVAGVPPLARAAVRFLVGG